MFEFESCLSGAKPHSNSHRVNSNLLDQTAMVGGLIVADFRLDSDTTKERRPAQDGGVVETLAVSTKVPFRSRNYFNTFLLARY